MHCAEPEEYSPTALEHVRSPRHYGRLEAYNGYARITGDCGDTMAFWLEVEDDRIKQISFITDGCGPSLASGSMAATLAADRPLIEAAVLRGKDILQALSGLPEAVEHCASLAADTLQAACVDYLQREDKTPRASDDPEGVEKTRAEIGESEKPPDWLSRIKRLIIILSGKGGTGKSTLAVNLAADLTAMGKQVGLLDSDITGPAAAVMLGLERKGIANRGPSLLPATTRGIKVISLGLLPESTEEAPAWRGPEKSQVISRFLTGTEWGELDFLIIDCPPGLGDEPLTIRELAGDRLEAVIVTTPQKLSAEAAREAILFCHRQKIGVLGVVENMAAFDCPGCQRTNKVFRAGGGRKISDDLKVPFFGSIPIDPMITECGDRGRIFIEDHPTSPAREIIHGITRRIVAPDSRPSSDGGIEDAESEA